MPLSTSTSTRKPKHRRSALTPQQKNDRQGKKAESEFRKAAEAVGGVVYRLYDTKDYQERIGASLAKTIEAFLEYTSDCLRDQPKMCKRLRESGQYIDLHESLRAYQKQRELMAQKQPADHIWLFKGTNHYVEVKSTRNVMHLPTDNLKESQLRMGCEVVLNGGSHHYFVVCYPSNRRQKPWAYWVPTPAIYELWLSCGQPGIPWHALKDVSVRVPLFVGGEADESGCRWDLRAVLVEQTKLYGETD